MMDRYTKEQILDEVAELEDMIKLQPVRLGMGPANADRALQRLQQIKNLVKTNGRG